MSNSQFWNERYSQVEYAYGKSPNVYFFEEIKKLRVGKLLLPCEGEGRNAVAASKLGWEVTAFDQSDVGKRKALALAAEGGVRLDYKVGQLKDLDFGEAAFDAIGLVFAHMPVDERANFHRSVSKLLKPGGYLILEGFHIKQLGKSSGGPQQVEMLFTEEILRSDFNTLTIQSITDLEVELDEGPYHKGKAHVIRMLAYHNGGHGN
jgi:SAM-dependent methyltransferase